MRTASIAVPRALLHFMLAWLLALMLAACGGGSDSDSPVAPTINTQPASTTLVQGQSATFSVAAAGSAPLAYQWRRNGTDIAGANAVSHSFTAAAADNGAQYSVVVSNAAGSITSSVATLTVGAAIAPGIGTEPTAASVVEGSMATFSVVATGSDPLTYQWRRDGIDIGGATAATYTTPATNIAADNGANYSVLVMNAGGSATSGDAALTVTAAIVAPAIVAQPANQSVNAGATATFEVVATGSAPLAYQWRRNGAAIDGASGSSYTTPATVEADDGALFSVVVSNPSPTVATSAEAMLTVTTAVIAPAITTQPASAIVTAGASATFSVAATGTAPSYQWRRNAANIAGADSASYTTPPTAAADNGALFSVVVSNSAGSATSADATLSVTAAPGPGARITIVVPYAAGGATDTLARRLATALTKQVGAEVIVSNNPGAGGVIGATAVSRATPDGSTLLLTDTSMATMGALYRALPFDPLTDFKYLGLIDDAPLTVMGKPALPANDYPQLKAWMQANAGSFSFANGGLGSPSDLCLLAFQSAVGVEGLTVPFRGSSEALQALNTGVVDLLCDQVSIALQLIETGAVKSFGVTSSQRVALAPMANVPTFAESGLPGFYVTRWHGLYAPSGTPQAAADNLNAALVRALADPDFVRGEQTLGASIVTDGRSTPAGHLQFVQSEAARWGALIKARNQYAD